MSREADASEPLVPIAQIVKAVGLRGEVKLYPLLDFHAPLLESRFLRWDDGETAVLGGVRTAGNNWFAVPKGCRDRDGAERWLGRELTFRREDYRHADFPRPAGGLPFRFVGRPVVTRGGEALGRVVEVRRYAAQHTLVIGAEGNEILVPAVEPILAPDDALEGPLVIDPPEGLLDANV